MRYTRLTIFMEISRLYLLYNSGLMMFLQRAANNSLCSLLLFLHFIIYDTET